MAGEPSTSCRSLLSVPVNRRAVSGISDFQPTGKLKSCWVGAGKTKVTPFKAQPRGGLQSKLGLPTAHSPAVSTAALWLRGR